MLGCWSNRGEEDKFANLFLAAKCLAEVRNRADIATVAHQLSEQIKALTAYDLNYPYQKYLDEEATTLVRDIRTRAVSAISVTWQEEKATSSWLRTCAQSDEDSFVRMSAVRELAQGWKNDPETLLLASKLYAQSDKDNDSCEVPQ